MATKKSLTELMEARGLGREDVAITLRVSMQQVSNWRQGRCVPHPAARHALAEVLGVTAAAVCAAIEESARRRKAREDIGE